MEARDRVSKAAVQVKALLDPQLREALENLAKSEGVTPSEYLERLIRKELETEETETLPLGS
jgi:DNA-binding transcriptional ArsR family regulator